MSNNFVSKDKNKNIYPYQNQTNKEKILGVYIYKSQEGTLAILISLKDNIFTIKIIDGVLV